MGQVIMNRITLIIEMVRIIMIILKMFPWHWADHTTDNNHYDWLSKTQNDPYDHQKHVTEWLITIISVIICPRHNHLEQIIWIVMINIIILSFLIIITRIIFIITIILGSSSESQKLSWWMVLMIMCQRQKMIIKNDYE